MVVRLSSGIFSGLPEGPLPANDPARFPPHPQLLRRRRSHRNGRTARDFRPRSRSTLPGLHSPQPRYAQTQQHAPIVDPSARCARNWRELEGRSKYYSFGVVGIELATEIQMRFQFPLRPICRSMNAPEVEQPPKHSSRPPRPLPPRPHQALGRNGSTKIISSSTSIRPAHRRRPATGVECFSPRRSDHATRPRRTFCRSPPPSATRSSAPPSPYYPSDLIVVGSAAALVYDKPDATPAAIDPLIMPTRSCSSSATTTSSSPLCSPNVYSFSKAPKVSSPAGDSPAAPAASSHPPRHHGSTRAHRYAVNRLRSTYLRPRLRPSSAKDRRQRLQNPRERKTRNRPDELLRLHGRQFRTAPHVRPGGGDVSRPRPPRRNPPSPRRNNRQRRFPALASSSSSTGDPACAHVCRVPKPVIAWLTGRIRLLSYHPACPELRREHSRGICICFFCLAPSPHLKFEIFKFEIPSPSFRLPVAQAILPVPA